MKKLSVALLIYLGLASAALAQGLGAQPIVCNKVVVTATLTVGTTQLVAGATGQLADVCGFVIQGIGAGTVQLVAGTGASCTTPTNISANFVTSTTSLVVDHIATAFFSTALGQSVCAVVTGAASVATVDLYYAQP
jgi:hypothetical protein